jgi:hypothetical protein
VILSQTETAAIPAAPCPPRRSRSARPVPAPDGQAAELAALRAEVASLRASLTAQAEGLRRVLRLSGLLPLVPSLLEDGDLKELREVVGEVAERLAAHEEATAVKAGASRRTFTVHRGGAL